MSSQYQINTTVTPIFPGGYQTGLLVYNPGSNANPIYIGRDTTVSATSGLALAPGTSVEWDAESPLYAISPSAIETLVVETDAANLTSASDIATSLITSGLPADIAAQIALNGAPSIDAPLSVPVNGTWFDVRKYSSLDISVVCNDATNPLGNPAADLWLCEVSYVDDPNPHVYAADFFTGHSAGNAQITLPTRGTQMKIDLVMQNTSADNYNFTNSSALLSYRVKDTSAKTHNTYWDTYFGTDDAGGNAYLYHVMANATDTIMYPSYRRGLNSIESFSNVSGGSTSNFFVELRDAFTGVALLYHGFTGAAFSESSRLLNLYQQPQILYHNPATSGSYTYNYAQVAT